MLAVDDLLRISRKDFMVYADSFLCAKRYSAASAQFNMKYEASKRAEEATKSWSDLIHDIDSNGSLFP